MLGRKISGYAREGDPTLIAMGNLKHPRKAGSPGRKAPRKDGHGVRKSGLVMNGSLMERANGKPLAGGLRE
jgi:hypothetical protein